MIKFSYSGSINFLFLLLTLNGMAQSGDLRFAERGVQALSDVIIHDITSPPVASRNYVYSFIAFYETVRTAEPGFRSYSGQINELDPVPEPDANLQYDWLTAGMAAFYKTSYAFVFSKELFQRSWDSIELQLKKRKVPREIYERSVKYGQRVADHILKWAREDHYIKTRTMPRFTESRKEGEWKQTPPDYMEAVEPYWNKIRPMTLTEANKFLLPRPIDFKDSGFLAACREVYETSNHLTKKQKLAANFWDCNPFATQTVGHLMYSVKKLSPAGHWIGITGIAVSQQKQTLTQALLSYSLVSVAIFDAIIAGWDEKYRSNYIRPVTAIQQLISPTWQPLLQTPPFPEYPSGHSVISAAAASVLTSIYGNHFRYVDNVEKSYGLPDRSFSSFMEAANEAAISRMYGGIHFREAIENGKDLGVNVGNYVVEKVRLR